MTLWVDADACPAPIKEILFRAAQRTHTDTVLVANHYMKTPATKYVRLLQVASGFDVADNEIVQRCQPGELVITSDIPLAAEVIEKQCTALSPRGEYYTRDNIRSRLNMRDFMDTLRSSGIQTGGPAALSEAEKQQFANQLDRWLQQHRA